MKNKAAEVGELWCCRDGGEENVLLILSVERLHREVGLDYFQYFVLEPKTGKQYSFTKTYPIRKHYSGGIRWFRLE